MEIIKLKKKGTPESIRTIKQGGVGFLTKSGIESNYTSSHQFFKRKADDMNNSLIVTRNAKRILNHKGTTEKQKKVAEDYLKRNSQSAAKIINSITVTMSRYHKDF